jgi:hypothetical protein
MHVREQLFPCFLFFYFMGVTNFLKPIISSPAA